MNGNLKTMTYPSGRVITYNYSNDRIVSVLKRKRGKEEEKGTVLIKRKTARKQ